MVNYFVGDIHGCYSSLMKILDLVNFDPNMDILHLTGDLISRGPNSLEVLRYVYSLRKSAYTVLGNHELHLLKTFFDMHNKKYVDYFHEILHASDSDELIYWLRHQSLLYINENEKILMTHAGIHPHWNLLNTQEYAREIESILTSDDLSILFTHQNISNIKYVHPEIIKRVQNNVNVFTRMRYIYPNGQLNLKYKGDPKSSPKELYPWFSFKRVIDPAYNIIFGHWASLKNAKIPPRIYGLDTGCCWGGSLTILQWEHKKIKKLSCAPEIPHIIIQNN
ncbi:symmetrical bis(5'-nucleosyl)-tetraphosphatase [Candidatus Blochmannia ocreatus (nom. nud.)]|uniref:bis(5'-nucleosyl)-tetraphosphatase (symmetrical) n=1 Tax=Candidatus Blochmannia ocreatus (nom. nud.) TaxID=251538 RepID=A0ABY4SUQ7_9ENTR|nr:symmetrical bis(5'-nucleosyl)-tetraphosphatase [Candidatus Blochmannia ocreatus]URJ25208.1 symmetrical bis(5'-nucleosyl)-tetraphosphatase [Candidatus Blochmannia ocreatus]